MSNELKNYYGYINLKDKQFKKEECVNYPNQKNVSGLIGDYYCGNDSETNLTNELYTKAILSKDLKLSVENIFGSDSYIVNSFDENIYMTSRYIYDENTNTYVLVSKQGGGTGPRTKYDFVSYTKKDNSIIIIESSSDFNEFTNTYVNNKNKYEIIFKLDDNSKYVFYSIEKK